MKEIAAAIFKIGSAAAADVQSGVVADVRSMRTGTAVHTPRSSGTNSVVLDASTSAASLTATACLGRSVVHARRADQANGR